MSCLLSTGQCGKRWVMVSCWIQKSDIHHDFLHSGSQVRASDKKLSYSNHKESWVLNRCSHWVRMGHSKPDTWVDHWSSILSFQETTPIYDSIVLSGRRWVWCMLIVSLSLEPAVLRCFPCCQQAGQVHSRDSIESGGIFCHLSWGLKKISLPQSNALSTTKYYYVCMYLR